jgi:hypothetical protein
VLLDAGVKKRNGHHLSLHDQRFVAEVPPALGGLRRRAWQVLERQSTSTTSSISTAMFIGSDDMPIAERA